MPTWISPARARGCWRTSNAAADVAVYREQADAEAMFTRAAWVFKDGEPVVRDGHVVSRPAGAVHFALPSFDAGVERLLAARREPPLGVHWRHAAIGRDELCA